MGVPWFGEGSIVQVAAGRHKGKWRLQWSISEGGRHQKIDKIFALKGDAVQWRQDKQLELRTGVRKESVRARNAATLQAAFEEFSGSKELDYADGKWVLDGAVPLTVATAAYRWNKWVKGSALAGVAIRYLSREDARAHVRRMKEDGASHQTITDVLSVLKKVVNTAIRERADCRDLANPFVGLAIESNHERAVRLKERAERAATEGAPLVTVSPKEAMEGIMRAKDPAERALLAVHLLAGLRLGEGMAICVEQLDFERGVIVVDRAVHLTPTGSQFIGLPKANKVRLAAMCPTLAGILEAYAASLPPARKHLFGAERQDKPRMKDKTYLLWERAVKNASLPVCLVPKGCRVSHNNWLEKLATKVSASTRLEHMGHSLAGSEGAPKGLAVNLKNYTAHVPEAYVVLRRELERVLGRPSRSTKSKAKGISG